MKERLALKEKETIKTLYASGKTFCGISKAIKRSPHTIKKYLLSDPAIIENVEGIKEELAGMFEDTAKKMLSSISDADIQKINAYQRTLSAGISSDKAAQLRGHSAAVGPVQINIRVCSGAAPLQAIDVTPTGKE